MEAPAVLASTTGSESSLAAQSSHLFQNASGFEIVGGQFVLGNVHNHNIELRPGHAGTLLPSAIPEALSESEIYCSQLLRQKRGFPLYVPGPQRNLPAEYRRNGVAIGDVGRVTPEGIFDFFFNIYLPPEHPINANIPEDFSPMPAYASIDVFHLDFHPGNYVSTSSVQKLDIDPPLDEFPGGDFVFGCGGPQGAVLALPHGAHLEKLENIEAIRAYAAYHAESWYKYINGARGRGLANGSLYLVTGCEKAHSWGMASYHNVSDEFQLAFKRTDTTLQYRWTGVHARKNPARKKSFNPAAEDEAPCNQTTFIHGLSISLGTGIWGRLFGDVKIRQIVDSELGNVNGSSGPYTQGSSLFSWSLDFFGGGATTGGKRHAEQDADVVLSDISPIAKIYHPGELINNHILQKAPHSTVVMTHDDDWCDILREDGMIQNPGDFLRRVTEQFNISEKDGVTFLVPIFRPGNVLRDPMVEIPRARGAASPSDSFIIPERRRARTCSLPQDKLRRSPNLHPPYNLHKALSFDSGPFSARQHFELTGNDPLLYAVHSDSDPVPDSIRGRQRTRSETRETSRGLSDLQTPTRRAHSFDGGRFWQTYRVSTADLDDERLIAAGLLRNTTYWELLIANLPLHVHWEDLKSLFRHAGTVLRAEVSPVPRGYGTVLFTTFDDASYAIEMFHGYSWQGHILEVRIEHILDFAQLWPEMDDEYVNFHAYKDSFESRPQSRNSLGSSFNDSEPPPLPVGSEGGRQTPNRLGLSPLEKFRFWHLKGLRSSGSPARSNSSSPWDLMSDRMSTASGTSLSTDPGVGPNLQVSVWNPTEPGRAHTSSASSAIGRQILPRNAKEMGARRKHVAALEGNRKPRMPREVTSSALEATKQDLQTKRPFPSLE